MPKKLENPSRIVTPWTVGQQARVQEIIEQHIAIGQNAVPWANYVHELGHNVDSIYSMARTIRARMRTKQRADYRAEVRAGLEPLGTMKDVKIEPAPQAAAPVTFVRRPAPKRVLDDERVSTSTQAFRFAAEMRNRIGAGGITAGLLGDPPPGRSALDERNGTKIEFATTCRRGTSRVPRVPSLPTRPIRI